MSAATPETRKRDHDEREIALKVLIVSWFFPPANTIGAVRLGNLTRFLLERGHDVHVLAGKDLPYAQTLDIELPADRVRYARWADVNALPGAIKRRLVPRRAPRETTSGPAAVGADPPKASRSIGRAVSARLADLYMNLTNIPDNRAGWLPDALKVGRQLLDAWRPDVIFASGPPFTALLVGYFLSRRYRLPLVVELRDRWSDDPYYPPPIWRAWIDRFLERRIIARAVGITTVSTPWATTYRDVYGKPVSVIFNGYDPTLCPTAPGRGSDDIEVVRIVYTGGIYPGRRDPSPLFRAIRDLGPEANGVRVEFYGTDPALVLPLAERAGAADHVVVHPEVSHEEAVHEQTRADVLLLMQWNDPREQGNVPGKFFEYLGVLRPILVLGLENGVPATFLRDRQAGFFSNDPAALAAQLKEWIEIKRERGYIPALREEARAGLSRSEQFAKLEQFLSDLLRAAPRAATKLQPSQ